MKSLRNGVLGYAKAEACRSLPPGQHRRSDGRKPGIALESVCEQRRWQVVQVYSDNGVSGAKGRDQRPGLDAMLKDASRGRFDVVLAWALGSAAR